MRTPTDAARLRAAGRCRVLGLSLSLLAVVASAATPASAQSGPLVIRPSEDVRSLAEEVARMLSLRLPEGVLLGESAPVSAAELGAGEAALIRDSDGSVWIELGLEEGSTRAQVRVEGDSLDAARAVALALEALRDSVEAPVQEATPAEPASEEPDPPDTPESSEDWALSGRDPFASSSSQTVTPLLGVGLLVSLSTERLSVIVGPRAVIGFCFDIACLGLEGDIGAIADVVGRFEYRPATIGMRASLRVYELGLFSFSPSAGLLARIGVARVLPNGRERIVSSFGFRVALDFGFRASDALEVYVELGTDIHTEPTVFTFGAPGGGQLVEDLMTIWGVLGLRLRVR